MLRSALLAVLLLPLACQSSAPPAPAAEGMLIRVVKLEHTQAKEIEGLLADILTDRGGRTVAVVEGTVPPPPASAPQYKVAMDAATNSVILSGTAEQIAEALELIAKLDVVEEPARGPATR